MNYLDKNVLYNLHTKNTTTNQTPLKNALFSVDNPLSLRNCAKITCDYFVGEIL